MRKPVTLTARLLGSALLIAVLPGQALAETPVAPVQASSATQMAAQKQAKKHQMMMQMMRRQKAAAAARIPTTTAIYDPAGGNNGRNLVRYDQPLCLNWRGGPKGTLLPSNMTPPVVPMPGMHGVIGIGYSSACDRGEALLSFSNRGANAFVRGMIYSEAKGGYTAPDGGSVQTSSDRLGFSVGGGFFRSDGSFLSLDLRRMQRDKIRYAGASVDTRQLDVSRLDAAGKYVFDGGAFNQLRFNAKIIEIDRINDNFTYRTPAPQPLEVYVNRKTTDIGVALDGGGGAFKWTFGAHYAADERDATRYMGPLLVSQSPNFADAKVAVTSLTADGTWALAKDRRIKAGLQLDFVDASLGGMDRSVAMPTPTPRQVYMATYGYTGNGTVSETNIGGSLRFERDLGAKKGLFFVGLSREIRTADPRERYFTSIVGMPAAMWIGNPNLKPEKHHMLEIGAGRKIGAWQLAGRAYVDHVDDFILWDRARGQAGVAAADGRNIFRNVDAFIGGVEASAKYKFGNGFWAGGDIWLTHGENLTDNRAIGQIPAAEAALKLGWANDNFSVQSRLRLVSASSRVDDSVATGSGVDGAGLSGYGLLDVSATWKPKPNVAINFGIENLLDKTYTPLIERSDIASPTMVSTTGGGRSVWVNATFKF